MARYYNSWQNRPTSMYNPLPLEVMAQDVQKKQQETDAVKSGLNASIENIWMPGAGSDARAFREKQRMLQEDLAGAREKFETGDIKGTALAVGDIRNRYNISQGTGINYGTGAGTSGSTKTSGSGNPYEYGTPDHTMNINEINRRKAVEAIQKDKTLNENDRAYLIDKTIREYDEAGGAYGGQGIIDWKSATRANIAEDMDKSNKGWKHNRDIGQNANGDFIDVNTNEYITYEEVYGSDMKYMLNNEQYNRQWERDFWAENDRGELNLGALASNGIYSDFMNTPEARKINDSKMGDDAKQTALDEAYREYADEYLGERPTEESTQEEVDAYNEKIYNKAEEQYKWQQAHEIADYQGEKYSYSVKGRTKYKDPRAEFKYGKALEQFKYDLEKTPSITINTNVTKLDGTDGKAYKTMVSDANVALEGYEAAQAKTADSKQNLLQAFNISDPAQVLEAMKSGNIIEYVSDASQKTQAGLGSVLETGDDGTTGLRSEVGNPDAWIPAWNAYTGSNLVPGSEEANAVKRNLNMAIGDYNTSNQNEQVAGAQYRATNGKVAVVNSKLINNNPEKFESLYNNYVAQSKTKGVGLTSIGASLTSSPNVLSYDDWLAHVRKQNQDANFASERLQTKMTDPLLQSAFDFTDALNDLNKDNPGIATSMSIITTGGKSSYITTHNDRTKNEYAKEDVMNGATIYGETNLLQYLKDSGIDLEDDYEVIGSDISYDADGGYNLITYKQEGKDPVTVPVPVAPTKDGQVSDQYDLFMNSLIGQWNTAGRTGSETQVFQNTGSPYTYNEEQKGIQTAVGYTVINDGSFENTINNLAGTDEDFTFNTVDGKSYKVTTNKDKTYNLYSTTGGTNIPLNDVDGLTETYQDAGAIINTVGEMSIHGQSTWEVNKTYVSKRYEEE